jgi:hypothetical protein
MNRLTLRVLVHAWLLTALSDGIYASALTVFVYKSTFSRLWQGVASVLLGPSALDGGARTVLVGLLMHLAVALAWTTVFLALALSSPWLRRVIATRGGVFAVAAVYGPFIWMVMSLVVIPRLTGRPPTIAPRWWGQLVGHMVFVALPMVSTIARGLGAQSRVDTRPMASPA